MSRPALGPIQPPTQWVPGLFPERQSGRGVNLTIHLHLRPRWMVELYLHSPIHLHGTVLNQLRIETTLLFTKVLETEFLKATFLLQKLIFLHVSCVSVRVYLDSVRSQSNNMLMGARRETRSSKRCDSTPNRRCSSAKRIFFSLCFTIKALTYFYFLQFKDLLPS
jgi:hypothetical protein